MSSDAIDGGHRIAPLKLAVAQGEAWIALRGVLEEMRGTRIVADTGEYLQVECRSTALGFVDDLEFQARPEEGIIALRSASRVGFYDFGANRRRVESLRQALSRRGVIQKGHL